MFLSWLSTQKEQSMAGNRMKAHSSGSTTYSTNFIPEVEVLEELNSVSAIRDLSGFRVNSLPPEDDSPSSFASMGFTANFFGTVFNQLFVNNNGNVTVNTPLSQ